MINTSKTPWTAHQTGTIWERWRRRSFIAQVGELIDGRCAGWEDWFGDNKQVCRSQNHTHSHWGTDRQQFYPKSHTSVRTLKCSTLIFWCTHFDMIVLSQTAYGFLNCPLFFFCGESQPDGKDILDNILSSNAHHSINVWLKRAALALNT